MAQKEIFNCAMKTLSRYFPTLNSQISLPWESLLKVQCHIIRK
jgi:hypothetical protein